MILSRRTLLAGLAASGTGIPAFAQSAPEPQLVPIELVGRTLAEAGIRERHHVTVVCVKPVGGTFTYATVDTELSAGDLLVVAGETEAAEAFARLA